MSYRLTTWSRSGEVFATFKGDDENDARTAWRAVVKKPSPAILWHRSEPKPGFPGLSAFTFDKLLMTQRVAEIRANLPRAKWDLRAAHGVTRLLPVNVRLADTMRPDGDVPLVAPDLVRRLGSLETDRLDGHKVFRTALTQLGVRRWSDFEGLTEADLLYRINGERDLLDAFRIRVDAFAKKMKAQAAREGIRFYFRDPSPPVGKSAGKATFTDKIEVVSVQASEEFRRAEFREKPLLARVRKAMAHIGARDASMLSRRLGLDGHPAGIEILSAEFGLERDKVEHVLVQSVAKLEELDGWPGYLRDLVDELLPISGPEMSGMPWLAGLDPVRLACLVRFGTGADIRVATMSSGHVVGPADTKDWTAMRAAARRLVLTTELRETPSRFLAKLRAGTPDGMERYERFILREIGWPTLPGKDWLLTIKARMTPHALASRDVNSAKGPLGALATAAALRLSQETTSELVPLPRRPERHPDAPETARVRRVCERTVEHLGTMQGAVTTDALVQAARSDPALIGIEVDAELVEAAVRSSSRLSFIDGRIAFAPDEHGFDEVGDEDDDCEDQVPGMGR